MQEHLMINKELNKFIGIWHFKIIYIENKKILIILGINLKIILLNINVVCENV